MKAQHQCKQRVLTWSSSLQAYKDEAAAARAAEGKAAADARASEAKWAGSDGASPAKSNSPSGAAPPAKQQQKTAEEKAAAMAEAKQVHTGVM